MPSRIVREGINSSPRITALSMGAELLYRRLMSVADDHGRYYGAPDTVRGACWPTCPKRFKEGQIMEWMRECSIGENPLIEFYEVNGCSYLQITNFGQQIRGKSKFPERLAIAKQMITDANQLLSTCEANAQPSRIAESYLDSRSAEPEPRLAAQAPILEIVKPAKPHGTRFTLRPLPPEWAEYAMKKRGWSIEQTQDVFDGFTDYFIASTQPGAVKLDWLAAWRGWVRKERDPPESLFRTPRNPPLHDPSNTQYIPADD